MAIPKMDAGRAPGCSMAPVRVAVADGRTLVRKGCTALLHLQAGVVVTAEIADGREIGTRLAAEPCDVLLLDQQTWLVDECDIHELRECVRVVLLADDGEDPTDALNALRHGARGVVFRSASVPALLEAIRTVAAGQVSMPPELQAQLAETLHGDPKQTLTRREREIVRQVAVGLRNCEIGTALGISEQTVKTHLGRIFRKLGVRDRLVLALYAGRHGLGAAVKTAR